jgi:hypothetical protein
MKVHFTVLLMLLICLSLPGMPVAAQADTAWQTVGDGIDYQEFHFAEPNDVYVARMDRANRSAILDSAVGEGRISHGTERVSAMFRRYDDAINFWGGSWGQRNQVVVAINGSYFNEIGAPESGQVISGWYAKRFTDLGGGSGLAYGLNRSVAIGQCVLNDRAKQNLVIHHKSRDDTSLPIDGVNIPRGTDQLILYTPQYDDFTHTTANGLEVLVEMSRPTLILPFPASADGFVRQIRDRQGQSLIPFDHVVLSASGKARERLLEGLQTGDRVQISQEITSYDKDCASSYLHNWSKTYASIGGAFNILRDGQIVSSSEKGATIKNPRTAMAYNDEYIFFIVVDGRNPQRSAGMTFDEVAAFARDTLGATWAILQDGGGSSVMVVNGQVKNHPVSACYAVYLPLVQGSNPQPSVTNTPAPAMTTDPRFSCERSVANAMLMINVQPAERSQTLHAFDLVTIPSQAEIRLGPGSNYPAFRSLSPNTQGLVLPHAENLNGIKAKGSYWWKVAVGNNTGWIEEQAIVWRGSIFFNFPTRILGPK